MIINPDASYSVLLDDWHAGRRDQVIQQLADDHPGLVAVFLVQGIQDRRLNRNACNEIANRLIEFRVAACPPTG